jgi:hypothetical protein
MGNLVVFVLLFIQLILACPLPSAFATPPLKTRTTYVLDKPYKVFYQWANVNPDQLHVTNLSSYDLMINDPGYEKLGRIGQINNRFYNDLRTATLNVPASIRNTTTPYLLELLVSEEDFNNARMRLPTSSSTENLKCHRIVRQFSGGGFSLGHLATLQSPEAFEKIILKGQAREHALLSKSFQTYFQNRVSFLVKGNQDMIEISNRIYPNRTPAYILNTKEMGPKMSVKWAVGSAGNLMGFTGSALSLLSPSMNPYAQSLGLNCQSLEKKINRLVCEWDNPINPLNNTVNCTVVREIIEMDHENRCETKYDVLTFTVHKESKNQLKHSGLLNKHGTILESSVTDFTIWLQAHFKILNPQIKKNATTGDQMII